MGLFARARSLLEVGKPGRGLLYKSLLILDKLLHPELITHQEAKAFPPKQEAAVAQNGPEGEAYREEKLLYQISLLPESFSAPALLFALLKDRFALKSAALLLYDPRRLVFAPWASTGFDTTTRHRLRLPLGLNEEFNRAARGEVVVLTDAQLQGFKGFFSAREFSALAHVVLVPFVHSQRLIGLLLIAQMGLALSDKSLELLRAVAQPAAALIHQAREKAQQPEGAEPGNGKLPLSDEVQAVMQTCRREGNPLILMRLSLEDLLSKVLQRHPYLDGFRLREELQEYCSSLFRVIGKVHALKPRELLVLIHGMRQADPPLLTRQLEISLRSFIRDLSDTAEIDFDEKVRIVSEDPQAALAFLAEQA